MTWKTQEILIRLAPNHQPSPKMPLPLEPHAVGHLPCSGSGVVVATGGGLLASQWLGQSVAFLGKAYAEYAVADAFLLTTVPSDVTLEDACALDGWRWKTGARWVCEIMPAGAGPGLGGWADSEDSGDAWMSDLDGVEKMSWCSLHLTS